MTYEMEIQPSCQTSIKKLCKKNPVLEKAIKNKMEKIIEKPNRYKSLRYDLVGERRVHILKSFVLKFRVDENNKTVRFISFSHHDEAYKR